jgi:hypothetical protein
MIISDAWKRTIDDALTNRDWDQYDRLIQRETDEYNRRFGDSTGFSFLDWRLFKATVWVESGGPKGRVWRTRVMQIGNKGDPGLGVLRSGTEGSNIVMSEQLKGDVKGNADEPNLNIRAGMAYVLTKLLQTAIRSVDDPGGGDEPPYEVIGGDNLEKIATKVGTTVDALKEDNPGVGTLHIGQKLRWHRASRRQLITGWRAFTAANVARHYNGNRDSEYAPKLNYCMGIIERIRR